MNYNIIIDKFEGPLDLLLYLIKKNNMKIEDISILEITEQYLEFINKMEEINLNIASEYLVMAAELIEMKSLILLPKREMEEEELIDPREELIKRLKEYSSYKELSEELKKLELERKELYTKAPSMLNEYKEKNIVSNVESINLLTEAFKDFLKKKELDKPIDTKVTTKEYSVQKRNQEIKEILKKHKKIEFTELFTTNTKEYIIVTFLSILDLTRKQEIKIIQETNFDKIYLIDKENK